MLKGYENLLSISLTTHFEGKLQPVLHDPKSLKSSIKRIVRVRENALE